MEEDALPKSCEITGNSGDQHCTVDSTQSCEEASSDVSTTTDAIVDEVSSSTAKDEISSDNVSGETDSTNFTCSSSCEPSESCQHVESAVVESTDDVNCECVSASDVSSSVSDAMLSSNVNCDLATLNSDNVCPNQDDIVDSSTDNDSKTIAVTNCSDDKTEDDQQAVANEESSVLPSLSSEHAEISQSKMTDDVLEETLDCKTEKPDSSDANQDLCSSETIKADLSSSGRDSADPNLTETCENSSSLLEVDSTESNLPEEAKASEEITEISDNNICEEGESENKVISDADKEAEIVVSADDEEFHDTHGEEVVSDARDVHHDEDDEYDTVEEEYADAGDDYTDDENDVIIEHEEYGEGEREEDGGSVEYEDQDGKEVDEDEDRRNPQYIPKKGIFYEHDDRLHDTPDEEKEVEKSEDDKEGKQPGGIVKKLWRSDTENKWGHDMFNVDEQIPKHPEELKSIYGYDIRNESVPPRARRRRKYGRGPNKYTRNWEDENAYTGRRGNRVFRGRGGRMGGRGMRQRNRSTDSNEDERETVEAHDENVAFKAEDFPSLNRSDEKSDDRDDDDDDRKEKPRGGPRGYQRDNVTRDDSNEIENQDKNPDDKTTGSCVQSRNRSDYFERRLRGGRFMSGRGASRVHRRPSGSGSNVGRTFTRTNGTEPFKSDKNIIDDDDAAKKNVRHVDPPIVAQQPIAVQRSSSEKTPPTRHVYETKPQRPMQKNVPPRLASQKVAAQIEASSNRPKRYSSLRQRNMAEGSNFAEQTNQVSSQFYEAGPVYADNPRHVGIAPQGGSPPILPNVCVASVGTRYHHHPNYNSQAYSSIRPSLQSPPPSGPQMYNAAPPIATTYITPAPNGMNYGPPAAAAYAGTVPTFAAAPPSTYPPTQPYTASTSNVSTVPVSHPQEVYHAGMAFYNMQIQSVGGRHAPSKRPKAAIPIVPPPEKQADNEQADNSESTIINPNNESESSVSSV